MAHPLHKIRDVWYCAAVVVGVAVLSIMALSCIIPTPAEFETDAGTNAPPFIVWDSADPPFIPPFELTKTARKKLIVTVGDVDLEQSLRVRLCLRDTDVTGTPVLLFVWEQTTGPSTDGSPLRRPVVTTDLPLCQTLSGTSGQPHYLYVVVTDGNFTASSIGCDVTEGSGSSTAVWTFLCTDQ